MVGRRCPYGSDLRWVIWSFPFKMNGIDEKWMNRGRISEMRWNEWFDGIDLEQPYGKVPMASWMSVPMEVTWDEWFDQTLSKWSESMRNEWIEWNEVNRGEMKWFDGFDLNEPYGNLPMVDWECPYQSDLRWVIWSNPIKMIRIDEIWMNWSE